MLWHHKLLHRAGENRSDNVVRFAALHAFLKTPQSLPDALVTDNSNTTTNNNNINNINNHNTGGGSGGGIWRDWSAELREAAGLAAAARL